MTGQETRRAIAEARRAVGASSAPVTHLENALQKYLSATTHLSHPTEPATVPPATAVRTNDQVPKAAAPTTLVGATTVDSPFIVVAGVDASSCSRRAARWAAAEALRRNGSLLLIHAYSLPPAGYSGYNPYPASLLPQLREEGEAMLSDIAAALGRDYPALNIETRMTYGDPATVLRHTSATAQLTVVGARGGNRVLSALGSVAVGVATTIPGPVVVIHPGAQSASDGPVLVGVDGSTTSNAAMTFGFEAASLRGVPLVAVHCWTDPVIVGDMSYYAEGIVDPAYIETEQRLFLSKALVPWSAAFPDVVVKQVVVHGRPAPALLEYSRTAQLTVVGSHGRNGMTGMLLGSTSVALITHSPSPVVIVRAVSTG